MINVEAHAACTLSDGKPNHNRSRCSYLAELTHGVPQVVGADELEVLDRGHRHSAPKVEAVVSLREGGLPGLEEEHAAVPALVDVRQLKITLDRRKAEKHGKEKG